MNWQDEQRHAHNAFLHTVANAILDLKSRNPELPTLFWEALRVHHDHVKSIIPATEEVSHRLLASWHAALVRHYDSLVEYFETISEEPGQHGYTSSLMLEQIEGILEQESWPDVDNPEP